MKNAGQIIKWNGVCGAHRRELATSCAQEDNSINFM